MQLPKLSNDQHSRVNNPQALVVLTGFHIPFMVSLFLCKKRESLDRTYNKQKNTVSYYHPGYIIPVLLQKTKKYTKTLFQLYFSERKPLTF